MRGCVKGQSYVKINTGAQEESTGSHRLGEALIRLLHQGIE